MSQIRAAAPFNVSKGAVLKLITDAGLTRSPNTPSEQQIVEAERLYVEEGWSLERIGQQLGFRNTTIHRHLKRRGVAMRRPWQRSPG